MPGLAFVGLVGQYSLSSDVLPGRLRDAGSVVERLMGDRREVPLALAEVSSP